MEKTEVKIDGMSCMHCVMAVKKELSKIGAESFQVEIGSAKVEYDPGKLGLAEIENAIVEAGYKVVK